MDASDRRSAVERRMKRELRWMTVVQFVTAVLNPWS